MRIEDEGDRNKKMGRRGEKEREGIGGGRGVREEEDTINRQNLTPPKPKQSVGDNFKCTSSWKQLQLSHIMRG